LSSDLILIDNTPVEFKTEIGKFFSNKSNIHYIQNGSNLGVAKALNQGVEKAIELGCKWCLLLDQDSSVDKNLKLKMGRILSSLNGRDDIAVIGSNLSDIRNRGVNLKNKKAVNEYCYRIRDVITSGSLISTKIWKNLGGFDEKLFVDMVDNEYCLRARKNGYEVLVTKEVLMKHNLGNPTVKRFFGKEFCISNHNPKRRYYIFRNYLYCGFKYLLFDPLWSGKILLSVLPKFIIKIFLFEENRRENLKWTVLGIKDFVFRKWDRKVL